MGSARIILLSGGHDWRGEPFDVLIVGEHVAAVGTDAARHPQVSAAHQVSAVGRVLLPAPAEPHAHLDKALLGRSALNQDGTLAGALRAMRAARVTRMTRDDILARARRAAATALCHGFTAIRSHVDVGADLAGVDALAQLREELRDLLDLQLVALITGQVAGREGLAQRQRLRAALECGCDVVGGAPWRAASPDAAVAELTAAAADSGAAIDLHLDETTDAATLVTARYLYRVEQLGLGGRATASHCVSLGQQEPGHARKLAAALRSAGVAVVTLPQTNLALQGRGVPTRVPRALPPIDLLVQEGVRVAAGGDNWQDPFNPAGRIDPMETASLLTTAGHLPAALAYEMVSVRAREVLGLPPAALRPGQVADLIAVRSADLAAAVAGGTEDRMTWHRGRLVASSQVRTAIGPDLELTAAELTAGNLTVGPEVPDIAV